MSTVLVADDDAHTRLVICKALQKRQYRVVTAANGVEACTKAMVERPDLVILDVEMPGRDGFEVVQQIRQRSAVPVIFLSVHFNDLNVVMGLKMGADDFIAKPFSEQVLLAKVEAALRRASRYGANAESGRILRVQDLEIDCDACEVRQNGQLLNLTATEYKLLLFLAERVGKVVDRDRLLDHLWGSSIDGLCSRTVDVHVGRLRRKLGDTPSSPRYIFTVLGMGYKLKG
ncbi:MAG: response regulator transcription factor [Armatimonadota bacterium]